MTSLWGGRTLNVPCTVDIEKTWESFHAYAVPEDVDIQPGDTVLVHGAPGSIGYGERILMQCRATVRRAGLLDRIWTRTSAMFELTELFEVGFQPKEH